MSKALRVGILGLGTVGSGFYEILENKKHDLDLNIEIVKILVKDPESFKGTDLEPLVTNDFENLFKESLDVVVEVMGGLDPTYEYVSRLIENNTHIITANKDLIAEYGDLLFEKANESHVRILYEASVGGSIPIIKTIRESLVGNDILRISGILNGTSNYIISRMEEGLSYDEALKLAKEKGFAEANPKSDVEGLDAARKLGILINIGLNRNVDWKTISTAGVDYIDGEDIKIAYELGYSIKILAEATCFEDDVSCYVKPVFISKSNQLAGISNEVNGIIILGDRVGESVLIGKGAGKYPTGSAVFSDLVDLYSNKGYDNKFKTTHKEKASKYWNEPCDWIVRLKGLKSSYEVISEKLSGEIEQADKNSCTILIKNIKEESLENQMKLLGKSEINIKKFRIVN